MGGASGSLVQPAEVDVVQGENDRQEGGDDGDGEHERLR
jgi:hypothetical protein